MSALSNSQGALLGKADASYFLQTHSLDDAFQMWLDGAVGHFDSCYWDGWRDVCNASINDAIEQLEGVQ